MPDVCVQHIWIGNCEWGLTRWGCQEARSCTGSRELRPKLRMWVKELLCIQSGWSRCAHGLHTGCEVSLLQTPMLQFTDQGLLTRTPCSMCLTCASFATVHGGVDDLHLPDAHLGMRPEHTGAHQSKLIGTGQQQQQGGGSLAEPEDMRRCS